MAAKISCDVCNKPIHTDHDERKFRIDFLAPKERRGFDICETCYMEMRNKIRVE